jgi:hypothetical protein
MTGDPVAWTMIERGWKVYASGGEHVGQVEEIAGDENVDIFDGLSVETHLTDPDIYVPAESVGTITTDRVDLTITQDAFTGLSEYVEPASQIEIESEKAPFGTRIHQDVDNVLGEGDSPKELQEHQESWLQRTLRHLFGK